jgi:hypothetical protein
LRHEPTQAKRDSLTATPLAGYERRERYFTAMLHSLPEPSNRGAEVSYSEWSEFSANTQMPESCSPFRVASAGSCLLNVKTVGRMRWLGAFILHSVLEC